MADGFGSGFMGGGNIRIGNGFMKRLPPGYVLGGRDFYRVLGGFRHSWDCIQQEMIVK
jgi:hypothetical protein